MLARLLLRQLRQPQTLQQQCHLLTAAATAGTSAAAAAAGSQSSVGWLQHLAAGNNSSSSNTNSSSSSIRWFSSSFVSFEDAAAGGGWDDAGDGRKRLYIGNLAFEATKEDVEAAFSKIGKVLDCTLPTRPDGRHKGFGFVELDAAAADAAIEQLDQSHINGRPIHVKEAEAKGTRGRRYGGGGFGGGRDGSGGGGGRAEVFVRPGFTRLYVGNLNFRTSAADLGRHFQQFGAVQDCVIPLDPAGRSRGYGFVELDDAGAERAVQELNGVQFDGRHIVVRGQREA